MAGSSSFKVGGVHVQVEEGDGPVCKVREEDLAVLHEGVEVEQEQFLSEPDSVFQEFIRLWRPRWNQHEEVGPEHWRRILNFARFLTPIASFDFPAIHRDQWLQAARKLKTQAARGPDGYARADLLNMAPSYVDHSCWPFSRPSKGGPRTGLSSFYRGSCGRWTNKTRRLVLTPIGPFVCFLWSIAFGHQFVLSSSFMPLRPTCRMNSSDSCLAGKRRICGSDSRPESNYPANRAGR